MQKRTRKRDRVRLILLTNPWSRYHHFCNISLKWVYIYMRFEKNLPQIDLFTLLLYCVSVESSCKYYRLFLGEWNDSIDKR